jgi:hypothetical protein
VGLGYWILGLTCGFTVLGDHAVTRYSLVSPPRIGLRRTWWSVRLITGGSWAAWVVGPGRMRAHADQMYPAGAMLDRDQDADPPERDGVHVQEVHGQDGRTFLIAAAVGGHPGRRRAV